MNITLIGMAGVGKSHIGQRLAKRLGYLFLDTDDLIIKKTGTTPAELVKNSGDDVFMEVEIDCILEINGLENHVVSTGGSVVYSREAMMHLKRMSRIIYLHDNLENISGRLEKREMLELVGLREKGLARLYAERLPLYRRYADLAIDIPDDLGEEKIVDQILEKIRSSL